MGYEFYKPKNDEDFEAFYQMLDAAFPDEDVRGITKRLLEHHPCFSNDHFFMVKKDQDVVAGLILLPQTWVIDGIEVEVAEMGCVGTPPVDA